MSNAKLILFGEHSVVYDKKAIGLPLKSLKVNIEIIKDKIEEIEHIKKLKEMIKKEYGIKEDIYIRINTNIPLGCGLGSSAAIAIEIAKEFKKIYNLDMDIKKIADISEKIVHGNPSGLDVEIIYRDRAVIFQKGKEIEYFSFNLESYLVIANTGIRGNTYEAIKKVKDNIASNEKYIENLGEITLFAIEAINNKKIEKIGYLMKEAHENLKNMNLTIKEVDNLIEIANKYSLGSKMTGAGLGGCIISLVSNLEEAKKLSKILLEKGAVNTWIEAI